MTKIKLFIQSFITNTTYKSNQKFYYFISINQFFPFNNSFLTKNSIWLFCYFHLFTFEKFLNFLFILPWRRITKFKNHSSKTNYILFAYNIKNYFTNFFNYIKILINIITYNVKWILVAFLISFLYFFISLFYIQIDITKQIAAWFILLIIYYLLMSTFNSFLVKYKYGKFTSAIQRFWKRTGMVFWLIEGFLFMLFFYYFLNSSQEPLYMFDYSNLNQELLIQLKSSYKNMILLSLAIYLSFIVILNNNFLNYYQNILLLSLVSLIVFYMLFIETYQFVYIINLFADKNWNFDENKQIWILEIEQNMLRVKQQYFILCLIAKYWHFIFIFISWFFFLIKSLESNKINYNLMGYNIQNLLILYILNLFCLVQWIKWLFKKFLEISYYWFHVSYDEKFIISLKEELFHTFFSLFSVNISFNNFKSVKIISNIFFYTNELNLWKYIKCY